MSEGKTEVQSTFRSFTLHTNQIPLPPTLVADRATSSSCLSIRRLRMTPIFNQHIPDHLVSNSEVFLRPLAHLERNLAERRVSLRTEWYVQGGCRALLDRVLNSGRTGLYYLLQYKAVYL